MRLLHFFGLQRVDLRLHRKTIIIDNEIGYTGSLNMIDPHTYDAARTVGPWVDAMVRLTGPAVQSLRATFLIDWAIQPDGDPSDLERVHSVPPIPQLGTATIVTVPSGSLRSKGPEPLPAARHHQRRTLQHHHHDALLRSQRRPCHGPSERRIQRREDPD